MSDPTLSEAVERLRAVMETAAKATPGPWEWTDCVSDDDPDCGLLQVIIPSQRPWDSGTYRLTIGDMEWTTGEDMNTARHIANCDPTKLSDDLAVMLAAVERLEHERDHLKRMVDRVIEQRGYVADDSVFDQLLAQYDAANHDAGHADTTGADR